MTCLCLLTQVEPLELFDVSEFEWVWREHLKTSVSSELGQILDKMIQPASKKRYQSATEVLQALGNQLPQTPPPKPSPKSSPQSSPQPSPDLLKSARGVDYTRLRDLLAAGKWKEADGETLKVMLKAARQEKEGCFTTESIENFPCDDLRTIDQLWVKYSQGRFGFSVQKKIWLEVGGKVDYDTECKLGDRLGWRKRGSWLNKSDLTFNKQAPVGHLPRGAGLLLWRLVVWVPWWAWGSSLASRAVSCNL